MQLATKLGTNTTEIKFLHWYVSAKGDIMLRFLKIWSTSKNHGKESMDFYINGKKT